MANPVSFTVTPFGLSEALETIGANQADANMRLLLLENRQRDCERRARETAKQHQQQLQQCETRLADLITTLSATISSSRQQSDLEARLTDLITTLSAKIEEAALSRHQQPASDSQLIDNVHALLGRLDTVERLFGDHSRDHSRHNGSHSGPYPRMQSGRSQFILAHSNNGGNTVSSDTMAVGSPFNHHGLTGTEDAALPVASLSTRPSLMFSFKLPPQRLKPASASRQEDHEMVCHMDDNADENVDSMSDDRSEVDMVPARQPSQGTANGREEQLFRDQGEEDSHLNCSPVGSSLRSFSATQTDTNPEIDELFNNIQVASHRARFYPSLTRDRTTRNQNFRINDDSIKNFKVRTHADQLDGRGAKRQRDVEEQDDASVRPQARRPRPQSQPVHGPRRVFVDSQQQSEGSQPAAQVQTQVEPIPLQNELSRNQSHSQPPEGQRRSYRHHVTREPMDGMINTPDFCKPSVCKKLNLK